MTLQEESNFYVCCFRGAFQHSATKKLNPWSSDISTWTGIYSRNPVRPPSSRENLFKEKEGVWEIVLEMPPPSRCSFNVVCLSETTREIDSMHQEPNLPNWPPLPPSCLRFVLAIVQWILDELIFDNFSHSIIYQVTKPNLSQYY